MDSIDITNDTFVFHTKDEEDAIEPDEIIEPETKGKSHQGSQSDDLPDDLKDFFTICDTAIKFTDLSMFF